MARHRNKKTNCASINITRTHPLQFEGMPLYLNNVPMPHPSTLDT